MKILKISLPIILFAFQSNFCQVGINTLLPLSTLDINGNLSIKVLSLNGAPGGSATLIMDGVYISLNPTSGNQEFYVEEPSVVPERVNILRNTNDFNSALIYTSGGKKFFPKNSTTGTAPNEPLVLNSNAIRQTVFFDK
jgi:hypothetical protein